MESPYILPVRVSLLQGVIFICLLPCNAISIQDSILDSPRVLIEHPFVDMGEHLASEPLYHVFHFGNQGKLPLTVQIVKTSCGCFGQILSLETLEPGTSGSLSLGYIPKINHKVGSQEFKISLATNDPDTDVLEVSVKVRLVEEIEIHPRELNSWKRAEDGSVSTTFILQTRGKKSLPSIISIQASNESVHVQETGTVPLLASRIEVEDVIEWPVVTSFLSSAFGGDRIENAGIIGAFHQVSLHKLTSKSDLSEYDKADMISALNLILGMPTKHTNSTGDHPGFSPIVSDATKGTPSLTGQTSEIVNAMGGLFPEIIRDPKFPIGREIQFSVQIKNPDPMEELKSEIFVETDSQATPFLEIPIHYDPIMRN